MPRGRRKIKATIQQHARVNAELNTALLSVNEAIHVLSDGEGTVTAKEINTLLKIKETIDKARETLQARCTSDNGDAVSVYPVEIITQSEAVVA